MRTIKFRAWDTQEKTWRYYPIPNDLFKCHDSDSHPLKRYKNWCEFTGLLDKNGKEIFEGDIVKLLGWNPNICEVVFNRGGFCFRFTVDDSYYPDGKYLEDGEVIGNIYENTELIK